ncbi:MAG: hypothetical protein KAY24_03470 [Candidatus Eisenbacteria sp.]|nr:hypothetical protein [Candidatus Eisenbacteria bacterium]
MSSTRGKCDLVRCILDRIAYFAGLNAEERRAHWAQHPTDVFAVLPHPSGRGSIFCGQEVHSCLRKLADSYLNSRQGLREQLDRGEFDRSLHHEFVRMFLAEGREPSEASAKELLLEAVDSTRTSFVPRTHHIPCSLPDMDAPTGFRIGPVWFRPRDAFLKQCGSRTPGGRGAGEYLKLHKWVASIRIGACHAGSSRQHALAGIEGAFNILRLLIHPHVAEELSTAFSAVEPSRIDYLTSGPKGGLHEAFTRRFKSGPLPVGWVRLFRQDMSTYLQPAESALKTVTRPGSEDFLSWRFIHSASWFGDAYTEPAPAGQIVKYVTALETMTLTRGSGDRLKRMALRGAALRALAFDDSPEECYSRLAKLYNLRSKIVHGERPPLNLDLDSKARSARDVAQRVIVAGLLFLSRLSRRGGALGRKQLEQHLTALERRFPRLAKGGPWRAVGADGGAAARARP